MNRIKIVSTKQFSEAHLDEIRAVSPRVVVEVVKVDGKVWPSELETDAEILYTRTQLPALEQAPHLRWVHTHFAGNDHLRDTAVWHANIHISNASGIHAPNMGEYTMAHILLWSRRVREWFMYQRRSEWPDGKWDKFLSAELHEQTVGIIGYGQIGREVARLAKAFKMRVAATKRDPNHLEASGYSVPGYGDPEGVLPDKIYPVSETGVMAAECDYLINIMPLTDETYRFLDGELFEKMKETAVFINIGRGGSVDENALIHALKTGMIAGASLDVFEQEPLPADSPLWQMENVIMTPHIAGDTPNYDKRAITLFTENLRRYINGEPLLNLVHRERQY